MLKQFSACLTIAVLLPLPSHADESSYAPENYRLVWADEFEGEGLPSDENWVYDTEANESGWYNNELQYYAVARPETTRVENGILSIIARKERLTSEDDYGGQNYSSGRLITRGKAEWTYGHFEMRAKLPCGQGTWPSFFSLGPASIPWPDAGEIDIMSEVGAQPDTINPTIHTAETAKSGAISKSYKIADACEAFHVYHATWTPTEIRVGADGTDHLTFTKKEGGFSSWPFNKPRYLIINLAIGGDAGGKVDDEIFPVSFDIDYIRVYQAPQ